MQRASRVSADTDASTYVVVNKKRLRGILLGSGGRRGCEYNLKR